MLAPEFGSELGTCEASLPNLCLLVSPKDPSFEGFWRSYQMESWGGIAANLNWVPAMEELSRGEKWHTEGTFLGFGFP